MPYIHFYLDNIKWNVHEIHVAYWNRDEKSEDLSHFEGLYLHEFKKFMVNDAPIRTKLMFFYGFRKFCINLLKQQKYDFIIILHSIPAIVLYDRLTKCFNGRYIFDYRDSTYEPRVKFFKRAVGNIIRQSLITFTSSDGFREYFPKDCQNKIITSHNLLEDSLEHRTYAKTKSDKIRLSFWGFIRHVNINMQLQDRIGNDSRFELHYYGREQADAQTLKKYAKDHNYKNVFFHGEYKPEDRYDFVKNTDIIHNIYKDTNMLRAMGNKYYDGVIFRIPQLCFPSSQMAKMCETAGVGISLDPEKFDFCDKLYLYYHKLDIELFNQNCDKELKRVMNEYNAGKLTICSIFNRLKY